MTKQQWRRISRKINSIITEADVVFEHWSENRFVDEKANTSQMAVLYRNVMRQLAKIGDGFAVQVSMFPTGVERQMFWFMENKLKLTRIVCACKTEARGEIGSTSKDDPRWLNLLQVSSSC